MKYLFFLGVITLASCTSDKGPLCNCIEAGEALNTYSQSLFTRDITQEVADSMALLRKEKETACEAFETMDGAALMREKEKCSE